jgi:NodT family efflux transporter outer membrane factor (OMF) lipoprotein
MWFSTQIKASGHRVNAMGRDVVAMLCAGVLLAGCSVGPNYRQPEVKTPMAWKVSPTTQASVMMQQAATIEDWWATFNDDELNSLIRRAVRYNLNVQAATERIREARAELSVAASGFLPTGGALGSYQRSFAASKGTTVVTNGVATTSSGAKPHDLWQAGFDATWELDIFGGVRRAVETANYNVEASIEDRRDVMVTLLAEVATDYIMLRGYQQEYLIATENLGSQIHTAGVTRKKVEGGFVTELDVANADAQVATTRSQAATFESLERQTIYGLSILLGQEPTALDVELTPRAQIPVVPPVVPIGLPAELLRRRPDIRRAERQLAASTATIGVATAQLYPTFSFSGTLTVQGSRFQSIGNWGNRAWSFGPSFNWPILDYPNILSNIEVDKSLQAQAFITYRSAILSALRDVQVALAAYAGEQQRRAALADAVAANQKAHELALKRYNQGLTDFLNVLDAERSLYASQDALVQSNEAVGADLVSLYKAMGGGWEIGEPPATQPAK